MKITNLTGLPEALVEAVKNDGYDKGDSDFTVTGLLRPPQQAGLMRQHWDELEEDATERIWSLLGQAVHAILERAAPSGINEQRLYATVLDQKIGAKLDHLDLRNNQLSDYKITSGWTRVYGSRLKEWEQQLNLYAYILRENGYEVDSAEIVAIYRDWSKLQATKYPDWPQAAVEPIPVRLWSPLEQFQFICRRVHLHSEAVQGRWPPCSDEERWHKPDKFAVMKHGRKTAVRVFDDLAMADHLLSEINDGNYYIDRRPGDDPRCNEYCPVNVWCAQYKASQAERV